MFGKLTAFFDGEITVDQHSWHYRAYNWWLSHGGGNKPGYKENLCHCMRVILIWVPAMWFFKTRIYQWFRAWMATISLIFLAGLAFWLHPWITLGTTLGVIAAVAALIGLAEWWKERPDQVGFFFKVVFFPIWFPSALVIVACELLFDKPIRWVGTTLWGIPATLALFMFFVGVSDTVDWLKRAGIILGASILAGLAVTLALVAIGLLLIFLGSTMVERPSERKYARARPAKKGTSFVRMTGHYVLAKKRKICPFITLPGDRVHMT